MRLHRWFLRAALGALIVSPGCLLRRPPPAAGTADIEHYQQVATRIEYTDAQTCHESPLAPSPQLIAKEAPPQYLDLCLEEAVQLSLAHSSVLRDLSGVVLRGPGSTRTINDPAIVETDPRFGVESALAAFDANLATSAFFEKNDKALNNVFFGGGTRTLVQDAAVFQTQITKRAVTGTELAIRKNTDYDSNNAPGNAFPSAWNTNLELEARHPLLQGGGVEFNRIAGPSETPGVYGGVLLARINTDISLTDFEMGVRDLVSNVENTYWDLYLAYRNLHASVRARDLALEHWRNTEANLKAGRKGYDLQREADARRNYYRYVERVENAWNGRLLEGTRTNNGSGGGTLRSVETIRGSGGVRVNERRLRLLLGLPITDGVLLRPIDEPLMAEVLFDWEEAVQESLARRVELRRQKWQVKRRELELIASKNFLLPRLDAVGRYRWRGFGKDLLDPQNEGKEPFDNAYDNLTGGDFQEWQLGFEFSVPIGNRRGHAAVKNAQLLLGRERSVLAEQEREIVHDLSNAVAEVDRAYEVAQVKYNSYFASQQQYEGALANFESGEEIRPEPSLEAHYQAIEEQGLLYVALVDYSLAVRNVHFEKGSLLDYCEVYLAEGPWPCKAYRDAAERNSLRRPKHCLSYVMRRPPPISAGEYPQQIVADVYPMAGPPAHDRPAPGPALKADPKAAPPASDGQESPVVPADDLPNPAAAASVVFPNTATPAPVGSALHKEEAPFLPDDRRPAVEPAKPAAAPAVPEPLIQPASPPPVPVDALPKPQRAVRPATPSPVPTVAKAKPRTAVRPATPPPVQVEARPRPRREVRPATPPPVSVAAKPKPRPVVQAASRPRVPVAAKPRPRPAVQPAVPPPVPVEAQPVQPVQPAEPLPVPVTVRPQPRQEIAPAEPLPVPADLHPSSSAGPATPPPAVPPPPPSDLLGS